MTLARVFCGIAAADVAPWLTVAVVDDAGRLLDLRHLSDDPAGYAQLGGLLADRSGGVAPVALDRGEHLIAQLLAAARQPLAVADANATADFAERFSDDTSYDEMRAPLDQRRAVGLARALQAGALYAGLQSPSVDLEELKPVLAAHSAIAAGRQAAATALREVLRELYPAALRAYPDPAEFIPLKVLDALPEPSLLTASPSSRQRDAALIAELAATGVTDAQTAMNAISALRASVEESPRWGNNRMLAPVVAETVRQAVAAVRAADAASAALVAALVERLGQLRSAWADGAPARPYLAANAPVSPAPRRIPGPAAEVPPSRLAPRVSAASAAAAGVPAPQPAFATIPAPRSAGASGEWPVRDDEFAARYGDRPTSGGDSYSYPTGDGYQGSTDHPGTGYGTSENGYTGNGSGGTYPNADGYAAANGYSTADYPGGVDYPGGAAYPAEGHTDPTGGGYGRPAEGTGGYHPAGYANGPADGYGGAGYPGAPTDYAGGNGYSTDGGYQGGHTGYAGSEHTAGSSRSGGYAGSEHTGGHAIPTSPAGSGYPTANPAGSGYAAANPAGSGYAGAADPGGYRGGAYPAANGAPGHRGEPPSPNPSGAPMSFDDMVTTLSFSPDPLTSPLGSASPAPAPAPAQSHWTDPPAATARGGYPQAPPTGPANGGWHDPRFPAQAPGSAPSSAAPPAAPGQAAPGAAPGSSSYSLPGRTASGGASVGYQNGATGYSSAAAGSGAPAGRATAQGRADPLTDPLPSPSPAYANPPRTNGQASAEPDNELLIFSQTQSAWFTFVDEDMINEPISWNGLADDGWRAAEQLVHPTVGAATTAGLPRRVPQANLVPGSAQTQRRQLRIVRDAQSIAAHTEGYFRGWRRGQEIGGYAVGQRDRAAWEFNRDQRARSS